MRGKFIVCLSVFGFAISALGGDYHVRGGDQGFSLGGQTISAKQQEDDAAAAAADAAAMQQKYVEIFGRHPWRKIDGKVESVTGKNWVIFGGKVLQVTSDGLRIDGRFYSMDGQIDYNGNFFVESFPFKMADDEVIEARYLAKVSGVKSYTSVSGAILTIRNLDYGEIVKVVPVGPSPEEIVAQKKAAAAKEAAERTLKWNQDQAAAGDAFGELRMGERYRDGDGVEKDLTKARAMFVKSAAQGNKDASEALKNLPLQ